MQRTEYDHQNQDAYRELPGGARQRIRLMIILCEQCTEFSYEIVSVTGFLPLQGTLFLF